MGAAESTGWPNGTIEREEEGGSFTEKVATAAALAAIVAVAAWAVSRILAVAAWAISRILAVAAWAISRILSDNTNSDEKNDDTAIKSTNPSIRESIHGDRVISTFTDRGYLSTKGQSSGYYEGIISQHDGGSDVANLVWSPPPRGRFKMNTDGACKPTIKTLTPNRGNQPPIRAPPPPPDRLIISTKGESSGYGGIISHNDGDYLHFSSDVAQKYSVLRPPPRGRFKMNTAAVSGPKPGCSAYAGILRNDRGEWVRGFIGNRPGDTQTAQIYAILKGIMILDLLDLQNLILESDCCEAVLRIKENKKSYQQTNQIITECRRLAFKNNITVDKVYGDYANQCAEKLADIALQFREEFYFEIKELPRGIKHLVDKDKESYKSHQVFEKRLIDGVNTFGKLSRGLMLLSALRSGIEPGFVGPMTYCPSGCHCPLRQTAVKKKITYEGRIKRRSIWSPPPRGRYKMNTDGACKPNPGGPSGYGGILRDDQGNFVCCFHGFIHRSDGDHGDGLTAEFHGIHKGLKLLNKLGYMGSILETDCKAAFQWVTEKKNGPKSKIVCDCWGIIKHCRKLIRINKIEVEKIVGKHANKCADKLAAMALKEEKDYMEFEDVPHEVKSFVDKDKSTIKCV